MSKPEKPEGEKPNTGDKQGWAAYLEQHPEVLADLSQIIEDLVGGSRRSFPFDLFGGFFSQRNRSRSPFGGTPFLVRKTVIVILPGGAGSGQGAYTPDATENAVYAYLREHDKGEALKFARLQKELRQQVIAELTQVCMAPELDFSTIDVSVLVDPIFAKFGIVGSACAICASALAWNLQQLAPPPEQAPADEEQPGDELPHSGPTIEQA